MAITYISGLGLDSNDGLTEATPKKTISSATPIADGDTIRLCRGTAIIQTASKFPTGNLTIEAYGPIENGRARWYIQGGTIQFTHTGAAGKIYRVSGVDVINTGTAGSGQGIACTQGATLICHDFSVNSPFQNGVRCGYGNDHHIYNGSISNTLNNAVYVGTSGQTAPSRGVYEFLNIDASTCANDGISLHDGNATGYDNIIRYNNIVGGIEECIDIQAAYKNTKVYGNNLEASNNQVSTWSVVLVKNTAYIGLNKIKGTKAACVKVDTADDVIVELNLMIAGPSEANAQCLISTTTDNTQIYYNTFVGNRYSTRAIIRFVTATTNKFKNNFVYQADGDTNQIISTATSTLDADAFDGNYYRDVTDGTASFDGDTFANWQSTYSLDTNSTASSDVPDIGEAFVPNSTSSLFTDGVYNAYAIDMRGCPGRKFIGAFAPQFNRSTAIARNARSL